MLLLLQLQLLSFPGRGNGPGKVTKPLLLANLPQFKRVQALAFYLGIFRSWTLREDSTHWPSQITHYNWLSDEISTTFSALAFETGSPTEPNPTGREPGNLLFSAIFTLESQACTVTAGFFCKWMMGSLNSGPPACVTSAWPTELSSQVPPIELWQLCKENCWRKHSIFSKWYWNSKNLFVKNKHFGIIQLLDRALKNNHSNSNKKDMQE